ncbi:MAG: TIGR02757 family protein [Hymenobacteraceae bacterium]|nr:TIGR02757 family protein [Hymenobacteraceae bacterium]
MRHPNPYVQELLESRYQKYNQPSFIPNDPISIPHLFSNKQDIEISGFFASILAWGQRKTIVNKCKELMHRMDNQPHQFVLHHTDQDLKNLLGFKHRTFNDTDLLYLVEWFRWFYSSHSSLETAFLPDNSAEVTQKQRLIYFHDLLFSLPDAPRRTQKHVSTPARNSACKRINMYLRWMVRNDNRGVDFGIWNKLSAADLICPCDVHVERVARKLNLLTRKQVDWQAATELTNNLKLYDPADPVKYDFALFGLGIEEKF